MYRELIVRIVRQISNDFHSETPNNQNDDKMMKVAIDYSQIGANHPEFENHK